MAPHGRLRGPNPNPNPNTLTLTLTLTLTPHPNPNPDQALIAVGSGFFDGVAPPSGLDVAKALGVLVLTLALADLVESAVLVPLSARGVKLPAVLLACQGVALRSADQRMFRAWMNNKAT